MSHYRHFWTRAQNVNFDLEALRGLTPINPGSFVNADSESNHTPRRTRARSISPEPMYRGEPDFSNVTKVRGSRPIRGRQPLITTELPTFGRSPEVPSSWERQNRQTYKLTPPKPYTMGENFRTSRLILMNYMTDADQLDQQKAILLSLIDQKLFAIAHPIVQSGSDIKVILDDLQTMFSPEEEIGTKLSTFHSLKQSPGEAVNLFEAGLAAHPTLSSDQLQDYLVTQFIAGLLDSNLKSTLRLLSPQTLQQAVTLVQWFPKWAVPPPGGGGKIWGGGEEEGGGRGAAVRSRSPKFERSFDDLYTTRAAGRVSGRRIRVRLPHAALAQSDPTA